MQRQTLQKTISYREYERQPKPPPRQTLVIPQLRRRRQVSQSTQGVREGYTQSQLYGYVQAAKGYPARQPELHGFTPEEVRAAYQEGTITLPEMVQMLRGRGELVKVEPIITPISPAATIPRGSIIYQAYDTPRPVPYDMPAIYTAFAEKGISPSEVRMTTTKEGEIVFVGKQKPAPPSLSQQILEFVGGWQEQKQQELFEKRQLLPLSGWLQTEKGAMAGRFTGRAVGSVESFVYGVGAVAGVQGLPLPPASVSGAVIGTLISPVTEGQWNIEYFAELGKWHPEELLGSLYGDVLLGLGIGKVAQKPLSIAARKASAWWKATDVSKVWTGSRAESWLIRHSGWYRARVERGITGAHLVSYPQAFTEKGYPVVSKKMLEAQAFAWQLELAPRTSGLTISKFAALPVGKEGLPHLFFRKGMVSIGYLKPPLQFKQYMDLLVPESTEALTKRVFVGSVLPYIPKFVGKTTPKLHYVLSGFTKVVTTAPTVAFATMPQATLLKVYAPQILRRKTKPLSTPILQPKIALQPWVETESVLDVKQVPVAMVNTKTLQTQAQAMVQRTAQRTVPYTPPQVSPVKPAPSQPFEWKPRKPRKRRKKKIAFGWRYRVHAVAEPEQILGSLTATSRELNNKKLWRKKL